VWNEPGCDERDIEQGIEGGGMWSNALRLSAGRKRLI
jgi:hypothetical protein